MCGAPDWEVRGFFTLWQQGNKVTSNFLKSAVFGNKKQDLENCCCFVTPSKHRAHSRKATR